jgi:hypothetical protein
MLRLDLALVIQFLLEKHEENSFITPSGVVIGKNEDM